MSVAPSSPYTFGSSSGGSKGPGIGKSISDAVDAISGHKNHVATLEHIANESQKDHERNLETIKLNHSLGEKSATASSNRTAKLEAARHKNAMAATTGLVKHAQTLQKGAQPGTRMSVKAGSVEYTVGEKPAPKPRAPRAAAAGTPPAKAAISPAKAPKPRTPKGTK